VFTVDGEPIQPIRTKSVKHQYFGETFFEERSVWLPTDKHVTVRLGGEVIRYESPKRAGWPAPIRPRGDLQLAPAAPEASLVGRIAAKSPLSQPAKLVLGRLHSVERTAKKLDSRVKVERLVSSRGYLGALSNVTRRVVARSLSKSKAQRQLSADEATVEWATSASNAAKYAEAWVVMDRVERADDNGEHLYRHLQEHHPEINAWFLLSRRSKDWDRLEREGFRLVEYGSRESVALCLNSSFQISSDATRTVQYPISQKRYGQTSAKIVFLQHGVIMNDLSKWLNPKALSMIVTSTVAEHESIAGNGSTYRFTSDETRLTGLPRFDALIRKADALSMSEKDVLLLMPTWRLALRTEMENAADDAARRRVFENSEYGRAWLGVLHSENLRNLADKFGLQVVFVAHPAMGSLLGELAVPDHVTLMTEPSGGIQNVLARSRVLVTDYSSITFDLALIGVPTIYYQFDQDAFMNGGHTAGRGYFSYPDDGFGPAAETLADMEGYLSDLSECGFAMPQEYAERVDRTFRYSDVNNSERVVQEIMKLSE
jgi:hypothetical protein